MFDNSILKHIEYELGQHAPNEALYRVRRNVASNATRLNLTEDEDDMWTPKSPNCMRPTKRPSAKSKHDRQNERRNEKQNRERAKRLGGFPLKAGDPVPMNAVIAGR